MLCQTSERNSSYVFYFEKSSTFQSYQRPGAASKEAEVVDVDDSNLDEFDELTMEELRSLLDNFKNLSKSEQMDLVQYMRKLETTDPEKVRQLKDTTTATAKSNDAPKASRPTNERYWLRQKTPVEYLIPPGLFEIFPQLIQNTFKWVLITE